MPQQQPEIPAAPPAPPVPPTPAAPGVQVITSAGGTATVIGVPTTARELRALRSRRTELSNQLNSATDRRDGLVNELRRMPEGPAREGVEQRIQLLDQRILQLETDIAQTGQLVVATPAEVLTSSAEPTRIIRTGGGGRGGEDFAPIGVAFTLAVLMPIAIAFARRIWKRTGVAPVRAASREDSERLMRLEQAVDTIAVEVERISEGQRFVTQLMAQGHDQRQLAPLPTLEAAVERR